MSQFDLVLLKQIVEGLLLAANEPLSVKRIIEIFEDPEALFPVADKPRAADVEKVLNELKSDCEGRGFELAEVASGFRFQVRQSLSPWVSRLWDERPVKYSRAILETLALIAYRQPITRGDIEEIRGVAVSTNIIKTLLERQWVRVVGHRDVPGRPALYATTRQFLDYFNLKSLEELPSLAEIRDIDKINTELDFNQEQALAEQLAPAAVNDDNLADGEAESEPPANPVADSSVAAASSATTGEDLASAELELSQIASEVDASSTASEYSADTKDADADADADASEANTAEIANQSSAVDTVQIPAAETAAVDQTRALIEAEMAAIAAGQAFAAEDEAASTTTPTELTPTADEAAV